MAKLNWGLFLITVVWLEISIEAVESDLDVSKWTNPLRVKNMTGKVTNTKLEAHTVDVFYHSLTKQEVLDLIRVSVEITDPSEVEDHKGTILEVAVSNGRDNFVLQLPVRYPNLTQYSDGKLLNPMEDGDFGKKKKKSKNNKNGDNSTNSQNLVITVHSRLHIEIEYKLTITHLDRSQYIIKFKPDERKLVHANQHVTIVKPIGYFLDGNAQNVRAFHVTVTSDDDICANLLTLPANESLYNRRIDLKEVDNRRILSFTRRADVFLSEQEIESFGSFKIFVIITPDDSACSVNNSRKYADQNKKVTFEFEKLDDMSYTFPIIAMLLFLATPTLLFVPFISLIRNQQNEALLEANLIDISSDESEPSRTDFTHEEQRDDSNTNNVEVIDGRNGIAGVEVIETSPADSLTLHGKMIQYPVAIILPVLMHTAVEYHKWTTSTMANRDEMCFHNHACAKPYGELRAWNNIISNLGYLLYGSVFVAVTLFRRRRLSALCGTYECILIDVTIGVFMALQAVASATYHICPSDVAFQFDTPCIQVICTLLIIRQWLIRVECPSAAHSNIVLVAVVSLNFFISAFSKSFYVRYMLATIHSLIIGGVCYAKKKMLSTHSSNKKILTYFTAVFSITNAGLLLFYVTSSKIHLNQIVTYCCIFNCILYLVYYALMKSLCNERISSGAKLYGILAVCGWVLAASFFFQDDTDWTRSPAASRALNKPCLLFDFFGSHDLWHIFGAHGGLFTFLFVSVVDDDLLNTPKKAISVF